MIEYVTLIISLTLRTNYISTSNLTFKYDIQYQVDSVRSSSLTRSPSISTHQKRTAIATPVSPRAVKKVARECTVLDLLAVGDGSVLVLSVGIVTVPGKLSQTAKIPIIISIL